MNSACENIIEDINTATKERPGHCERDQHRLWFN